MLWGSHSHHTPTDLASEEESQGILYGHALMRPLVIIIMEIKLKERDFVFMKILGEKELSLGIIGSKMGLNKFVMQRILDKLEKSGLVDSRKDGRERLVKSNKDGIKKIFSKLEKILQ